MNFVQRTIKIHEVESANYELQVSKQCSAQDVLRVISIVDSMADINRYQIIDIVKHIDSNFYCEPNSTNSQKKG